MTCIASVKRSIAMITLALHLNLSTIERDLPLVHTSAPPHVLRSSNVGKVEASSSTKLDADVTCPLCTLLAMNAPRVGCPTRSNAVPISQKVRVKHKDFGSVPPMCLLTSRIAKIRFWAVHGTYDLGYGV